MPRLLKLKEVIEEYGICETTIEAAVRAGELPIYKLNGKTYYYKRSDIDEWINSKRVCASSVAAETPYDRFMHVEAVRRKHGRANRR